MWAKRALRFLFAHPYYWASVVTIESGTSEVNMRWTATNVYSIGQLDDGSWTDVTLTELALNTRNVVAVSARDTPEVISGLEK